MLDFGPTVAVEFVNFEPLPTEGKLVACFVDTEVIQPRMLDTIPT